MKLNIGVIVCVAIASVSCNRPVRYDLIIENASIVDFDADSVIHNKTILISSDTIAGIVDAGEPIRTRKVVDADGRIVVPGNIDSHTVVRNFLHSNGRAFQHHPKNVTTFYRNIISQNFLPFGITTLVDMETDSSWIPQINMLKSHPRFSDIIAVKQVNEKNFNTLLNNTDSVVSSEKVNYFYISDFDVAKYDLNSVDLSPNKVLFVRPTANSVFSCNCKLIEGISSIVRGVMYASNQDAMLKRQIQNVYSLAQDIPDELYILEAFNFLVENNPELLDSIVNKLATQNVSVSTGLYTLKEFAEKPSVRYDGLVLTKELKQRLNYDFSHLLNFVGKLYKAGVTLRVGNNSNYNGIAFSEEQKILADAGISVFDVFKISSLNSAKALKIDKKVGKIVKGYIADLLVYEASPFDNTSSFGQVRRIIKNGKVVKLKD